LRRDRIENAVNVIGATERIRPPLRTCRATGLGRPAVRGACATLLVAAAAWWWQAGIIAAQQPPPSSVANEYTVKAVFLYSFGRYVQWPEKAFSSAQDPFVIGVLGEDPFAGALEEIAAKKTVQDRRIVVRRFASAEEYRPPCHILFVSRSLAVGQQAAVIKKTADQAVLVVGETPGFAEWGGAANFFIDGDRVRFEINADAARRADLHMDAKLLSLGKPVGVQRPKTSN
jgi:hypothetical protein